MKKIKKKKMTVKVEFINVLTKSKLFHNVNKISYFEGYVILAGSDIPVIAIFPKSEIKAVYNIKNVKE